MNVNSRENRIGVAEETGVADGRRVREQIAAQHGGDLRGHVAETNRIVEPLIEQLGLKRAAPAIDQDRRSGTGS